MLARKSPTFARTVELPSRVNRRMSPTVVPTRRPRSLVNASPSGPATPLANSSTAPAAGSCTGALPGRPRMIVRTPTTNTRTQRAYHIAAGGVMTLAVRVLQAGAATASPLSSQLASSARLSRGACSGGIELAPVDSPADIGYVLAGITYEGRLWRLIGWSSRERSFESRSAPVPGTVSRSP